MKIVVTGATGHVGRYVVHELASAGHDVVAASRSGKIPQAVFGAVEAPPRVRGLAVDISQDAAVDVLAAEFTQPAVLVHLAAWHPPATAQTTAADRKQLVEVNVYGSMRVFQAAKKAKSNVRSVIYASTFEVYGDVAEDDEIEEQSRLTPLTDYGATKLAGEDHLIAFGYEERLRVLALRMPAVYGPGEHTPRALPNFLKQVARGERPTVHGDGEDLRDQLHARDAARAVICAISADADGIFNISDGEAHSIREIASLALEVSGLGGLPIFTERQKPRRNYHMNIERARELLGFVPRVPLREGMNEQYLSLQNH